MSRHHFKTLQPFKILLSSLIGESRNEFITMPDKVDLPKLGLPCPSRLVHKWNMKLVRNHIHLGWQIYQDPVEDINT